MCSEVYPGGKHNWSKGIILLDVRPGVLCTCDLFLLRLFYHFLSRVIDCVGDELF